MRPIAGSIISFLTEPGKTWSAIALYVFLKQPLAIHLSNPLMNRYRTLIVLSVLAIPSLLTLIGCGDKAEEARAARMENAIDSQRSGMKTPSTAVGPNTKK